MNTIVRMAALVFLVVLTIAPTTGHVSDKNNLAYPNELPSLKIYERAKWKSLEPYVSTVDDVKKLMGKPVAIYDNSLKGMSQVIKMTLIG